MADVLIVGELLSEIMAEKVGQRFDQPGTLVGPFPSGAPGIFIDQVAKLGVSSKILACVGKDGFGNQVVNRLKTDGVDVSEIRRAENLPTGTAFVTYAGDGSREFIFNIGNSAAALVDESMISDSWAAHCKFYHVMGSFLSTEKARALVRRALKAVKQAGGLVSFDPNVRPELMSSPGTKEALMEVLSQCNVFLPSELDLEVLFGTRPEQECVKELFATYPMKMIVVKKAIKGAVFYDRERSISAPAFKVSEVDPTGAGDAFGGAFVACLVLGYPIEKCLEYSCAAGALAVTKKGPMEGTATTAEIVSFVAKTPKHSV